jgi:hypothetical protein
MKCKVFRINKEECIVDADSEEDAVVKAANLNKWTGHSCSTTAIMLPEEI